MAAPFHYALCNELFQKVSLRETCATLRELGYSGIELAPFTIAEDPLSLKAAARKEAKRTIEEHGLSFVGLHWLLLSPPGLHITTPDKTVRKRSWQYVRHFIDLCADLRSDRASENPVLVFGSPKQRSTAGGMSRTEAVKIFTDELAAVAPHAESRRVQLLVEALPWNQSDVVNSLAEAVEIVNQIGSPAVETMFDVHNAVGETTPHPDLIRKYIHYIRHVHVNEIDGREPGAADYDFASILSVLAELAYRHWVSLEVFDFSRDPREVANNAIRHLESSLPSAAIAKTI